MALTHIDGAGNAVMVDVADKAPTHREAVAKGRIKMSPVCFSTVEEGRAKKGDVLGVAQVAGIMAVKRTADLIPLCHPLAITKANLVFALYPDSYEIEAACTVTTFGQTGVEMEALTGASIALLTIYDMCKALDRTMEIHGLCLHEKSGGESGHFLRTGDILQNGDGLENGEADALAHATVETLEVGDDG